MDRTPVAGEWAELSAVGPSYVASGGAPLLRFLLTALPDRSKDHITKPAMPVLVITGEHDRVAPPAWAGQLAALASAPFVMIPGTHNGCFPHPREADAALHDTVRKWTS